MALVKITMYVECTGQAEYDEVMVKLETWNPLDDRFSTQSLIGDGGTKIIELVYEPTTQVV